MCNILDIVDRVEMLVLDVDQVQNQISSVGQASFVP